MAKATIAVKGSASDDFTADFALVRLSHRYTAQDRSEALAGGNALIAQVRDAAQQLGTGVRVVKVKFLRMIETFNQVGLEHEQEPSGWGAHIACDLAIEPDTVPVAVAELTRIGVTINRIIWLLDPDTEARARRAVRRLAVADAKDAANDFALALGGILGNLIALADPGLLGPATFQSGAPSDARAGITTSAMASSGWFDSIDIDPEMVTISANVEASYEVTFD
ncbi:MAG TPA: SIMPL domain-containing protein [Acidimicrobiales bacterium]